MTTQRTIRGGRGLGDSIYLRPIAEYFLALGDPVVVLSDYPDVFAGIDVEVKQFTRFGVNVLAHYVLGKPNPGTNQWQDICHSAGVTVPLSFTWTVLNHELVASIKKRAAGRPIIIVHGGRVPMGRIDGFGKELLPEQGAFVAALDAVRDAYLVRVGNAESLYTLPCDIDLTGKSSVADLLDLASICDGVVGQCSLAIPLAEVFDRPLLIIWAAAGLASREPYVAQITPSKVLSKASSRFVMDDWPVDRIRWSVAEWRALSVSLFEEERKHACGS